MYNKILAGLQEGLSDSMRMQSGASLSFIIFAGNIPEMENDPELSGKYLGTISQDFVKIADPLKEASYRIRKEGFAYPIFPIAKENISIGQLLFSRSDLGLEWNYNASYLDEFVQRELIAQEKTEAFRNTYRDPDEFCCLFVVDQEFTKFLYIPYPMD